MGAALGLVVSVFLYIIEQQRAAMAEESDKPDDLSRIIGGSMVGGIIGMVLTGFIAIFAQQLSPWEIIPILLVTVVVGALLTTSLAAAPAASMDLLAYNDLGSGAQVRSHLIDMNANQLNQSDATTFKFGELKCGEGEKGETNIHIQ